MKHRIKCIQPFFRDVKRYDKMFEIRKNDRNYQVGDTVILREYIPETDKYTGNEITIEITYLIQRTVCLKEGYCAFGFMRVF